MPEFDCEADFKRLAEGLEGKAGALPFSAQMHGFCVQQSGLPAAHFYGDIGGTDMAWPAGRSG
ncbi:MAG: hypothetical protein QF797_08075 [Alphaproteobacteria bacterium]|nr:hypothetical protein [Alphaproteobacteria bacterium]MDP6621619.1 hypothetical protein [Alphaproteobacteria bacterium]